MQVVTQKLDLGQISMAHMLIERHIRDQTQISVADFSLDDSDNIFKCPRNFRVPPWVRLLQQPCRPDFDNTRCMLSLLSAPR